MELISHHQLEEFRIVQESSKIDTTCPTTSQYPHLWHPSWLKRCAPPGRTLESEWLAKNNLETNLILIKPKTARPLLLGSVTLLLYTRAPLPDKISCFAITCVFLNNSFPSVRQEPTFGPWKVSPFLQYLYCENKKKWSCMDVRVGLWRKLSTEKLMLLKCAVREDSWESLRPQGDPTSPS